MKKVLTMTLIAVVGLAAYGCNKTGKVNAAATNAQCDTSNCCGSAACTTKKAKLAAAGDAKSCCSSKAAVKPAATSSSKNKANCNPSDCGTWEKGSGSGCPFSGK